MTSSERGARSGGAEQLRVLHVIPEDGTGGVEIAAKSVRDHPDLACQVSVQFVLRSSREHQNGEANRFAILSWNSLAAYAAAYRTMSRSKADVFVFSLWKTVPLLVLARLFTKAKIVYFLHLEIDTHVVDAWLTRVAVRFSHAVWADSAAVIGSRGVPASKPSRVISFVTERLRPKAKPVLAPKFVSWGRLNDQKGVDRAIELIALLVDRGISAVLHAYGRDDGAKSSLVELANRLGVADRVFFPGVIAREDRAAVASGHAFFLQLSRFEGMCMGAVEGMQLGLVPVATPTGQMKHYVIPDATGLLADAGDLASVADELVRLLADPQRYAALSSGARRYWQEAPLYAEDVCQAAAELAR